MVFEWWPNSHLVENQWRALPERWMGGELWKVVRQGKSLQILVRNFTFPLNVMGNYWGILKLEGTWCDSYLKGSILPMKQDSASRRWPKPKWALELVVRFWTYRIGKASKICFGIDRGQAEDERKKSKKAPRYKGKPLFISIISII